MLNIVHSRFLVAKLIQAYRVVSELVSNLLENYNFMKMIHLQQRGLIVRDQIKKSQSLVPGRRLIFKVENEISRKSLF